MLPPLFKKFADVLKAEGVKNMTCAAATTDKFNPDEPCLIAETLSMSTWRRHATVATVLATYGGDYKKDQQCKEHHKGQIPMDGSDGCLTLTSKMFDQIVERFDAKAAGAKDIKNGKALLDTVMQFGYMPGHTFCNRVPYGVSTLKVFSMGEVCVVAVSIQDLVKHEPWPAQIIFIIVSEK